MRALLFTRYGPPDALHLAEVPTPIPAADELRIRVQATTVSRSDCGTMRAHPFFARLGTGLLRPKIRVLGMDFAGIVEAVGSDVTRFAPGDAVFGMSPDRYGGQAEFLCLPQSGPVAVCPQGIAPERAVICEGAWYAWSTVKRLRPGQSILIYGASGAIGTAAVQLAKVQGAEVTAVVGPRHLALARELGADRVVDYTAEDFTALTARFDIVMDAVGKTSFGRCRGLLKPGGQFCATDLGPGWSNIWRDLWGRATGDRRVSIPFPTDAVGFVDRLAGLMQSGQFKAVFDREYPIEDYLSAYRYVETGQKTGIVVLTLA